MTNNVAEYVGSLMIAHIRVVILAINCDWSTFPGKAPHPALWA